MKAAALAAVSRRTIVEKREGVVEMDRSLLVWRRALSAERESRAEMVRMASITSKGRDSILVAEGGG